MKISKHITVLAASIAMMVSGAAYAVGCGINLNANTHTCGSVSAISFVAAPSDHRAVAKISLPPSSGYSGVIFYVTYSGTPTNWTVNIGDSQSNNGWAGDGGTQSNDAEMQIKGNSLAVYGNDYTPPANTTDGVRHLQSVNNFVEAGDTAVFEVRNASLKWLSPSMGGLNSSDLYALNGQADAEGPVNYDIYAGFNRVIGTKYRNGSGAGYVHIELLPSPSSITIYGCSVIPERRSCMYRARVRYTDNTTRYITPRWSEDSSKARFRGSRLYTKSVRRNERVNVRASYTENGKTVTSLKRVIIRDGWCFRCGNSTAGAAVYATSLKIAPQ